MRECLMVHVFTVEMYPLEPTINASIALYKSRQGYTKYTFQIRAGFPLELTTFGQSSFSPLLSIMFGLLLVNEVQSFGLDHAVDETTQQ